MLSASSCGGARLAASAPIQTRRHDHRAAFSPAEPAQRPQSSVAACGGASALRSQMRSRGAASSSLSAFATGISGSVCTPKQRGSSLVSMVIPFQKGEAYQQPPPDLPSYLFKNRIVFLGMSLVPAVTELVMAELLYLQYEDQTKPIYMYINSTGTTKDGEKLGYETEAFAIYDTMMYVKPPIFTLCVGNAWGEAALLLAAGAKGNRSALPSSTIMLKQPIARFRGQATDINIMRKEIRNVKGELVKLYARHSGHSEEKIEEDIRRPMYLSPDEAVEYGIIDKVLHPDSPEASVVDSLRKRELIKG